MIPVFMQRIGSTPPMARKAAARIVVFMVALGLSAASLGGEVWIDVRSLPEHLLDNIEGDPRISHDAIVEDVSALYPDRDTEIHLYCASGGRAGRAAGELRAAGYSRVFNAGGIDDARRARNLAESP